MADVSKLRLDNTTYDIKDSYARTQLVEANEDIDELQENVIVPYLFIPYLDARYNPAGNCFAFIFENRCTLIDLGRYECFGTMSQQLIDKGVDTIDNIVITHWHGDHDSMLYSVTPDHAYDHLKTAFNCTNTKFYIPREAPAGFDADTGYTGITSSFSSENITILDNNTAFVWEGISFSVKNQSDEDYAHYVSIGTTDLNECSAIVYAEYKDFVFLDSGDICVNAQQRAIAQGYIKEANLLNVPHHGVNNELCTTFTGCINPQYAYVANNVPSLRYGNRDGIIWQAGLTATIFDNVNNKNGVEIHFNHGVTAKGIPLINSGYNLSSYLRTIYVSENVQVGDIQDGTQQHPYKDIAYVCSLCKGVTVIELLSDITVQAQFSNLTGSVTIHGNSHSLYGVNARFNSLLQLENVTLNGGSFIEFSWVFFVNVTFASTMRIYRSFINANNCTVNNVKFAEDLNYSFVAINSISGTVGNNNYLIEVPYYSYININGNTTGKNVNTNNMFCVVNDHTGLNTKYLMDNVRENLAASVNVTKFTKSFTLTNGSTYLLIASHSSGGVAVHAITTYGNAILIANVSASSFVHLTTSGLNLTVSTDWPVTVSLNKLT